MFECNVMPVSVVLIFQINLNIYIEKYAAQIQIKNQKSHVCALQ